MDIPKDFRKIVNCTIDKAQMMADQVKTRIIAWQANMTASDS